MKKMIIQRIHILVGFGPDKVMLITNLPEACWPFTSNLSVDFNCAASKAEEYVAEHFPNIPVEITKRV